MISFLSMQASPRIERCDALRRVGDDWVLPEETVPESSLHDSASDLLKLLLLAWVARAGRRALVGRNLGVHWDPAHPKVGVAPDVYVVEPPPPGGELETTSLRLWEEGHQAPLLAVEVVSASRPQKDYDDSPERYAASGVRELWIFDPKLAGPRREGGPFRIQVWRRGEDEGFERIYAGAGPAFSPELSGYLFAVHEGLLLRIADDEAGTTWWMTGEEAERAAKEAERAAKEAERAAKEAERAAKEAERAAKEEALRRLDAERAEKEEALRRLAQLEALLTAAQTKPK